MLGHFEKWNQMGRGGARTGAGRKPAPWRVLKRLALKEAGEEAEKSLAFIVGVRENEGTPMGIRLEAARDIMNSVWGKPRQTAEIEIMPEKSPRIILVSYRDREKLDALSQPTLEKRNIPN